MKKRETSSGAVALSTKGGAIAHVLPGLGFVRFTYPAGERDGADVGKGRSPVFPLTCRTGKEAEARAAELAGWARRLHGVVNRKKMVALLTEGGAATTDVDLEVVRVRVDGLTAHTVVSEDAPAAPVLISRLEAARRCGVCLETFDKHVRSHLVTRKIGRTLLVDEGSLRAWFGAQEGRGPADVVQRAPDVAAGPELGGRKAVGYAPPYRGIARAHLSSTPLSPAAAKILERLLTKHRAATREPKRKA